MPSACAVLDYFYAERDRYARVRQRANDLFHLLLHATERIQRRIAAQTEELQQCAEKEAHENLESVILDHFDYLILTALMLGRY